MNEDFLQRFGGVARLVGKNGLDRLRDARVIVIGLGGVGSWVVEALARTGVGTLTLVDLDELCISNVNRQLPAVDDTLGQFKAEVLQQRVQAISPGCRVEARVEFFTASTADAILGGQPDCVVDAIDVVENKCRLIAACRERRLPLVVCGGAGGRLDPTRIRQTDLVAASHDRLLAEVRRRLRHEFGFPTGDAAWGIPTVFSTETVIVPRADGTVCTREEAASKADPMPRRLNCETGYGSACFVTGAMGFAAAAAVVRRITSSLESR